MKKFFLCIIAALAASAALQAQNSPLDVKETTLSNGMQVWLNEDHSQPKVYGAVVVKAGGKDCPDTGLAHYLEHLLFKGTEELGTTDYASEKVWLDSIALCYNRLADTPDPDSRLEIQKEINRLSVKAADYAIPNEFDLLTARFGGTGLNAGTAYDYTFYYNTFSPQYINQWAELNSHRMLKPVFRLFQGELETVYEEKNRAADNTMQAPLFEMVREFSGGNPYSFEVIGSTENLKNPRLGEMMDFFHKYYVGCNMGLILSGDIQADTLTTLLERTFGRIPAGEVPVKADVAAPVIENSRDVKIKAELPLLKIAVYAFNGPTDREADAPALDMATALLTNTFSSGLLDSLVTAHKVLLAAASRVPLFNEMGIVGYAIVPSIPMGSLPKAEKAVRAQIEKIKRGEFSDSDLAALKLGAARNAMSELETISGRSGQMVSVMSQSRSWDDYLASVHAIEAVTREDVVRVANKYFTDKYIRFEKVMGSYPKDKVAAPEFDPIVPRHAGESSLYARQLMAMPTPGAEPRLLDFQSDVTRIPLADGVVLYYKKNPVNDLFSFTLRVPEGEAEDPLIPHVAGYVNSLGTDSLSVQQLAKAWQHLGSSFSVSSDRHSFDLDISGFDSSFAPSLRLMRHFTDRLKNDKAGFKELQTGIAVAKQTFLTGGTSNIMQAAMQRVFLGGNAPLLKGLSAKELKAVGMNGLLSKFNALMDSECSIFYCGSLPEDKVVRAITESIDLGRRQRKCVRFYAPRIRYDEPTVFFYNLPGSRQTQILTYQAPDAPVSGHDKACLEVLGDYFGGGMYSVMFQEVREFRAMAYSAGAGVNIPAPVEAGDPAAFYTMLGTQADKGPAALRLVDSLLTSFSVKPAGLEAALNAIPASANNSYPSWRGVATAINSDELLGYSEDPAKAVLDNLGSVDAASLKEYYDTCILPAPRSLLIVGDKSSIPAELLSGYGKVVELTQKDIYK